MDETKLEFKNLKSRYIAFKMFQIAEVCTCLKESVF